MEKKNKSYNWILASTLAAAFYFTVPLASASAPLCSEVFSSVEKLATVKSAEVVKAEVAKDPVREALEANYRERNAILAKRYASLDFVFKDPEAFVKTMKDRFEQQKSITPEDPRLFNFPEAAPTMKEIRVDLEKFRLDLVTELQTAKSSLAHKASMRILGDRSKKVETISKVLQYVKNVQRDIDLMVESNNYPYRDTVYTLYYYSRIRGFFQFKELNNYYQVAKYIDMVMHGYRRLNIEGELRLYETKGSPILQVRSGKISHEFRVAELPFRDAFERKDTLEYVIIPSVYALGSSAFMHVLPHKIHFLGATNTPVEADGFNRPGGLFWMHDVRHEADRYMKVNAYRKAQNLTPKQEETLALMQQKWQAEYLVMKNQIADANLKAAVEHYHFYTHHDVGVPLTPSMFLNHHESGMAVYYTFLWHKSNAKQDPGYTKWLETTRKAQQVLTQFWTERMPLEKQLLQKDPVKIKDWEEWFPSSHAKTVTPIALFNRAIENKNTIRLKTEKNAVEGVLTKVIYNEVGEVIHVTFSTARIVDTNNKVIPGQDLNVHGGGYSSPVGRIKTLLADGRPATLETLQERQNIEIQYESGIMVKGVMGRLTSDGAVGATVLTMPTAEVTLNGKFLYKPEWGSFDLLIGDKVRAVEFLQ